LGPTDRNADLNMLREACRAADWTYTAPGTCSTPRRPQDTKPFLLRWNLL